MARARPRGSTKQHCFRKRIRFPFQARRALACRAFSFSGIQAHPRTLPTQKPKPCYNGSLLFNAAVYNFKKRLGVSGKPGERTASNKLKQLQKLCPKFAPIHRWPA